MTATAIPEVLSPSSGPRWGTPCEVLNSALPRATTSLLSASVSCSRLHEFTPDVVRCWEHTDPTDSAVSLTQTVIAHQVNTDSFYASPIRQVLARSCQCQWVRLGFGNKTLLRVPRASCTQGGEMWVRLAVMVWVGPTAHQPLA